LRVPCKVVVAVGLTAELVAEEAEKLAVAAKGQASIQSEFKKLKNSCKA
jgi:hypothetical protein